mmetsp:Transcript_30055/g.70051  ORF Transcript_30055/g.70051 Transcript_30055/m.70051 type:complete len:292 (+) Transcript_30055:75-950(+)
MASGVFSLKTLNDNWFEDRLQPINGLTSIGSLDKKQARRYETDIANVGQRLDVLSRISRMPQRQSFACPDDGFNEKSLTSHLDFRHPKSHEEFVQNAAPDPKMMVAETVPEVCNEERRPVPGNTRGFGAVLQRHEADHGRRYWSTTHRDTFRAAAGRSLSEASLSIGAPRTEPSGLRGAGVTTLMMEKRVSGVQVGTLCGEAFRESKNPGMDTRTQRTWLYSSDPSLRHLHYGGKRPVPLPTDNELSAQIGDGEMSKIRAALEKRGNLCRNSTKVTKGNDKRPGFSIFQDD